MNTRNTFMKTTFFIIFLSALISFEGQCNPRLLLDQAASILAKNLYGRQMAGAVVRQIRRPHPYAKDIPFGEYLKLTTQHQFADEALRIETVAQRYIDSMPEGQGRDEAVTELAQFRDKVAVVRDNFYMVEDYPRNSLTEFIANPPATHDIPTSEVTLKDFAGTYHMTNKDWDLSAVATIDLDGNVSVIKGDTHLLSGSEVSPEFHPQVHFTGQASVQGDVFAFEGVRDDGRDIRFTLSLKYAATLEQFSPLFYSSLLQVEPRVILHLESTQQWNFIIRPLEHSASARSSSRARRGSSLPRRE